MSRIALLVLITVAAWCAAPAANAAYPEKPIRLVVPFGAGGGTDVLARLVADHLSKSLNTPVVVENRAGAGGTLGSDLVAKAAPDGYTLLMATNATLALAPGLYPKLPYEPTKDFTPVALVASGPSILVVSPEIPVTSVSELVAHLKRNPGKLNYGSAGNGSMAHISTSLFNRMAGTDSVHIPFKGGAAATQELVAGRLQFMIAGSVETTALMQAGKVRALAVTTASRFPGLDLPTISEAGLPGYEIANWFGVVGPAGMPAEVAPTLAAKIGEMLARPEVREAFIKQGVEAKFLPPGPFGEFLRQEVPRWSREVRQMNIKLD